MKELVQDTDRRLHGMQPLERKQCICRVHYGYTVMGDGDKRVDVTSHQTHSSTQFFVTSSRSSVDGCHCDADDVAVCAARGVRSLLAPPAPTGCLGVNLPFRHCFLKSYGLYVHVGA